MSSVCMCAQPLSRVRLVVTPWTVAHQAPPYMGFSGEEYCSGLPCPPPGDLPDPGMEPTSLTVTLNQASAGARQQFPKCEVLRLWLDMPPPRSSMSSPRPAAPRVHAGRPVSTGLI